MLARSFTALGLSLLAIALGAGTASAAVELQFDSTDGQVVPLSGGKTAVNLSCGLAAKEDCDGRIVLVPRGRAAEDLGPGPVGRSAQLAADPGEQAQPRIALSIPARRWVRENGPLPVMAELRIPQAPDPSKALFVDDVELVRAPAPTVARASGSLATASVDAVVQTYSWDFKLRPGTAVVLRDFRCPASTPFVAEGSKGSDAGGTGDIRVSASKGVGYGAFNDVHVLQWIAADGFYLWTLVGWPKGDLFSNNVFAPAFDPGTFSMTLTCTSTDPNNVNSQGAFSGNPRAASILQASRNKNSYSKSLLLPWNVRG